MPELRASRGRDFTPGPPVQRDTLERDQADPARTHRPDRVLPRARARTVEIRNGLPPFKPYRYRGTGRDQIRSYPDE